VMNHIRMLLALATFALAAQGHAETFIGTVVGVTDGDTIKLHAGEQLKIRLSGIDAPERKQPFGQASKQHLSDLAFQRQAKADCYKKDRYRRWICNVYVAEPGCEASDCPLTYDTGLAQVKAGLAWWYRKYAREQTPEDQALYEKAEDEARTAGVGLWSEAGALPPWEWRRR